MDYDIIPPPPPKDRRNPAGGLLNRYDASNLQVKILCVGMYGTGKSTFLNRWQTNLKTKTRTTINIDFYEKHVEGFFPALLQDRPDPMLVEPEDAVSPSICGTASSAAASLRNPWACVDFPSVVPANRSSPMGITTTFLTTAANFHHNSTHSGSQGTGGESDSEAAANNNNNDPTGTAAAGTSSHSGSPTNHTSLSIPSRHASTLTLGSAGPPHRSSSAVGGGISAQHLSGSTAAAAPPLSGGGGGIEDGGGGIALRNYRNPRYTDSTPNVVKALHKASEAAKKLRAAAATEPVPDRMEALQRSTQKKPIVEADGAQVLSIYSLTRELGALSGSGRTTMELYGLCEGLADIRRTVRDPRQVAACAMAPSFGYSYYEKKPLHVQCWDIQGQEHSRNMTRTYYTDAMGALVFVDVTRPESLADAVLWREDISRKVFVRTATDASLEGPTGVGGGRGGPNGSAAAAPQSVSRHGRGARSVTRAGAQGGGAALSPATPAASDNPIPNGGSGAAYDVEEECHIPCWLVLNKCDLMEGRGAFLPGRERWLAQTAGYRDLDDFCAKNGFVGWSLASAANNVNVNGIMDRMIQQCCNQFPREIYRFSTRGKQTLLQVPTKPRPKQQKKCCATK